MQWNQLNEHKWFHNKWHGNQSLSLFGIHVCSVQSQEVKISLWLSPYRKDSLFFTNDNDNWSKLCSVYMTLEQFEYPLSYSWTSAYNKFSKIQTMNKEESLHCSKSCENQMFDGQKRRDEAWVCVSDSELKTEWQTERER